VVWQYYCSALVFTTRSDHFRTTLGLVLTDDTVETVLPGGPAFITGLRQGDAIAKVSTWCSNLSVVCTAIKTFVSRSLPNTFP